MGQYIRASKNVVSMPGSTSIEELVEGQKLDGEIVTATATSEPKEEQLLQAMNDNHRKLQALYCAQKDKLDSRAAVIETAEGDFQQRVEETRAWYNGALQELNAYREQLTEERNELLLKQSDIEKMQEEAAQQATAVEALLTERRIGLDAHEEDLVAHEEALAAKLRSKDKELEGLVARWVQELEQQHIEALRAITEDHAGKLKEAIDTVGAAEAAKSLLEEKAKQLEATLEDHGKKVSALEAERDKALHSLMEAQVAAFEKARQLSSAKDSIAD